MNYKYHLLKYNGPASRLTCPNCGRKHCFSPYVDDNNNIIGESYGRCDHESSCGYVKYPPPKDESWRTPPYWVRKPAPKPVPKRSVPIPDNQISIIPMDIVKKTVRTKPLSGFLQFLAKLFDDDTIQRIVSEYSLGVTKSGDIIYYEIDIKGRCRTGKVMKYNPDDGHRVKDESQPNRITWVHTLLKKQLPEGWTLRQCLFGEHLLARYPDKPVCLVEAEKTAVIGFAVMPEYVWVATGGKGQLNDRVDVLEGRKVAAFPDVDGYEVWVEKLAERPWLDITISDYLMRNATPEQKERGADVADILIDWKLGGIVSDKAPVENPLLEEVRHCFSPEYWPNVRTFIDEFDLELVSITGVGNKC